MIAGAFRRKLVTAIHQHMVYGHLSLPGILQYGSLICEQTASPAIDHLRALTNAGDDHLDKRLV